MEDTKILNKRYAAIACGMGFILIGSLSLIPGEQNNIAVLGIGLILLALNLTRYISKIPVNGFSLVLGGTAFALGAVVLLRPVLSFPRFELPFIPILMIAIGLYLLIPSQKLMEDR
jgi:hypothetical protein